MLRDDTMTFLGDTDLFDYHDFIVPSGAEGRFYHPAPGELLRSRPWLEYLENPNGSAAGVAGLASEDGAVLGLMPHPERAASPLQVPRGRRPGGRPFFTSIGEALRRGW